MAKYGDIILSFQVEDFNNFIASNYPVFKKQEVAVDDLNNHENLKLLSYILKEENYVGENYRF